MKTISAMFEGTSKPYTFNTREDVKPGDKLMTTNYKATLEVIRIQPIYQTHLHIGGKNIEIKVLDVIKINQLLTL